MSEYKMIITNEKDQKTEIPLSAESTQSRLVIPCANADEFVKYLEALKHVNEYCTVAFMYGDTKVADASGMVSVTDIDVRDTDDGMLGIFSLIDYGNSGLTLQDMSYLEIGRTIVDQYSEVSKQEPLLSDTAKITQTIQKDEALTNKISLVANSI